MAPYQISAKSKEVKWAEHKCAALATDRKSRSNQKLLSHGVAVARLIIRKFKIPILGHNKRTYKLFGRGRSTVRRYMMMLRMVWMESGGMDVGEGEWFESNGVDGREVESIVSKNSLNCCEMTALQSYASLHRRS